MGYSNHRLPFSGNGTRKPKVYTDLKEFQKAEQAFRDSSALYNNSIALEKTLLQKGYKSTGEDYYASIETYDKPKITGQYQEFLNGIKKNPSIYNFKKEETLNSVSDFIPGILNKNLPKQLYSDTILPQLTKTYSRKIQDTDDIKNLSQVEGNKLVPYERQSYLEKLLLTGRDEDRRVVADYSNVKPVQPVVYQKPESKSVKKEHFFDIIDPNDTRLAKEYIEEIRMYNKKGANMPIPRLVKKEPIQVKGTLESENRPRLVQGTMEQEVRPPDIRQNYSSNYGNPNINKGYYNEGNGNRGEFGYGGIMKYREGGIEYGENEGDRFLTKSDTLRSGDVFNKFIINGKTPEYVVKNTFNSPVYTPKKKEESNFSKGLDIIDNVMSAPQRAATYAVEAGLHATGLRKEEAKYENPSDALGIDEKTHPWLKMGTDMILDPTNLLGIGLVNKAGKVAKAGKIATETAEATADAAKIAAAERAAKVAEGTGEYYNSTKKAKEYFKKPGIYETFGKDSFDWNKFDDYTKTYRDLDVNQFKNLVTTAKNSDDLISKLSKTGVGTALINDIILQSGEYDVKDNYSFKYEPKYKQEVKPVAYNKSVKPITKSTTPKTGTSKLEEFKSTVNNTIKKDTVSNTPVVVNNSKVEPKDAVEYNYQPNKGHAGYYYYDTKGQKHIVTKSEYDAYKQQGKSEIKK